MDKRRLEDFENWERDADFLDDVSEQELLCGAGAVEGSGCALSATEMDKLLWESVLLEEQRKNKLLNQQNASQGKVDKDLMYDLAAGYDYNAAMEKTAPKKDYAEGRFKNRKYSMNDSVVDWLPDEEVEERYRMEHLDKQAFGFDWFERLNIRVKSKDYDSQLAKQQEREEMLNSEKQVDREPPTFNGRFRVITIHDDNDKQQDEARYSIQKSETECTEMSNLLADLKTMTMTPRKEECKRAEEQEHLFGETNKRDCEDAEMICVGAVTDRRSGAISKSIKAIKKVMMPSSASTEHNRRCKRKESRRAKREQHNVQEFTDVAASAEVSYENLETLANSFDDDPGILAVAIFYHTANDVDELSFDPEDIITNIEKFEGGWWRGWCNNRYGLFPAECVVEMKKQERHNPRE